MQRTTDTADASAPSSTVVAPALGSAPVELRTSNGASLEIRLPDTTALSTAQRVAGSATVYDGPGAVDVAVKPLADGVRIATVLDNASAPTEYAYDFGQLTPVVKADGSVTISYSTPDFLAEVGTVSAPWARDAKGKAVPTHYVARGNTLVQVVDHTAGNFTYPIVADPTYGWGRYFYVFFNRAETATIASAGWGAAALTAACGFAGTAVGDPAGAAAGVALCGLYAGAIISQAGLAQNSSPKRCMRLAFTLGPLTQYPNPATYLDSRCA